MSSINIDERKRRQEKLIQFLKEEKINLLTLANCVGTTKDVIYLYTSGRRPINNLLTILLDTGLLKDLIKIKNPTD